jgi:Holliday junction resolvase RusA-like endonuclease
MTPEKTVNYEALIRMAFSAKYPKHVPLSGPIHMLLDVYIQISQDEARKLKKNPDLWPNKKPDLDNVIKTFFDAGNGLIYQDDKQVVIVVVQKYLSDRPRVEVEVKEMP